MNKILFCFQISRIIFYSFIIIAGDCPFINSCAGIEQWKLNQYHWMPIFLILTNLLCIIAGLCGDICMLVFMYQRKEKYKKISSLSIENQQRLKQQQQHSVLKNDKYNLTVPVHATILTLFTLVLFACLFNKCFENGVIGGDDKNGIPWMLVAISQSWNGVVIPFIVFKIFKSKKTNYLNSASHYVNSSDKTPSTMMK